VPAFYCTDSKGGTPPSNPLARELSHRESLSRFKRESRPLTRSRGSSPIGRAYADSKRELPFRHGLCRATSPEGGGTPSIVAHSATIYLTPKVEAVPIQSLFYLPLWGRGTAAFAVVDEVLCRFKRESRPLTRSRGSSPIGRAYADSKRELPFRHGLCRATSPKGGGTPTIVARSATIYLTLKGEAP